MPWLDRVKPQDTFGVVMFDDSAAVAVPARPIRDHHLPTVHQLIEGIHSGGITDLTGGYLLGLSEARRNLGATGATLLLLSDGHANAGITDPAQVGRLAARPTTSGSPAPPSASARVRRDPAQRDRHLGQRQPPVRLHARRCGGRGRRGGR